MKGEKFIEQKDLDGVEILTDNGYVPVDSVLKTVDMGVWMVKAGRFCLHCAGEHIVIMADGSERFVRELAVGDLIRSEDGDVAVEAVANCGNEEAMYDLIVGSDEHVYFADGILSHNTTTSMAYLLHCAVFRSHSTIAILSNKLETSVEVMDRIKFAFEQLPWFLRPGVVTWNKQRIEFDNGTKVFAAATSSSSVRGRSCVTGDTYVTVEVDGDVHHCMIGNLPMIKHVKKYYVVYKTINTVNGMEYIGCHGCDDDPLFENLHGSIFADGYLGSGKLIMQAVEEYGAGAFAQELIEMFLNREDAFAFEGYIANEDYVALDHTYNMIPGGAPPVLCGASNGFYGKTHSDETIQKIREISEGNKYHSMHYDNKIIEVSTGREFLDFPEFFKHSGITKARLVRHIGLGEYRYSDSKKQQSAMDRFNMLFEADGTYKSRELVAERCRQRFLGKKQTYEHAMKRGQAVKKWIENNPEKHSARMDKINKNPDKIAKTAEKHRGMKRSEEARKRMSEAKKGRPAHNKGMTRITNGTEYRIFPKDQEIPFGWRKG